ncbi:AmiS/UreI family transporter [Actinomycetospora sp. TBRC 11914]|uniref:AmiS/UreI family transporter n=1 Tax=Actinomycetospora sp. TBRC 11914 TaxID=2729387 RepID=UPI00145C47AB|nr:AmiS/UreI family transporter [Actinomycetospora sp. TBRC 11914]NMO89435.1 transporter [Actinomycetospora sp. TBRC 11914]
MASVGLFYVGAVLFMNGLLLLGWVEAKAAAILNLFVGTLQVVTPTYLIFTANGDTSTILQASGLYLFGFTYLYVGIGLLADLDTTGVGWFSLFVAIAALGFSALNFGQLANQPFGVIWLYWSLLWALFFVLLGLKRERLTRYTGWVALIEGWVTAAVPGFLLLAGYWQNRGLTAIVLAVVGVVMVVALLPTLRGAGPRHAVEEPEPTPTPTAPEPEPSPDRPLSRT